MMKTSYKSLALPPLSPFAFIVLMMMTKMTMMIMTKMTMLMMTNMMMMMMTMSTSYRSLLLPPFSPFARHFQQLPVYLCMIIIFIGIFQDLHDHVQRVHHDHDVSSWSSISTSTTYYDHHEIHDEDNHGDYGDESWFMTNILNSCSDHNNQNRSWPGSWWVVNFDWVLQTAGLQQKYGKLEFWKGANIFGSGSKIWFTSVLHFIW